MDKYTIYSSFKKKIIIPYTVYSAFRVAAKANLDYLKQ